MANDLIATIMGRKKRAPSPTGSSTARRAAAKVRAGANDAAEATIDRIQRAQEPAASA